MNMNEVKNYVKGLENFDFHIYTPETASEVVGGRVVASKFKEPGLYRVLSGSRGFIEEVERMDLDQFNIPTVDECIEKVFDPEENYAESKEYIEEFYMVMEDEENPGTLIFGFTEEEYDHYILVN